MAAVNTPQLQDPQTAAQSFEQGEAVSFENITAPPVSAAELQQAAATGADQMAEFLGDATTDPTPPAPPAPAAVEGEGSPPATQADAKPSEESTAEKAEPAEKTEAAETAVPQFDLVADLGLKDSGEEQPTTAPTTPATHVQDLSLQVRIGDADYTVEQLRSSHQQHLATQTRLNEVEQFLKDQLALEEQSLPKLPERTDPSYDEVLASRAQLREEIATRKEVVQGQLAKLETARQEQHQAAQIEQQRQHQAGVMRTEAYLRQLYPELHSKASLNKLYKDIADYTQAIGLDENWVLTEAHPNPAVFMTLVHGAHLHKLKTNSSSTRSAADRSSFADRTAAKQLRYASTSCEHLQHPGRQDYYLTQAIEVYTTWLKHGRTPSSRPSLWTQLRAGGSLRMSSV